MSQIIETLLTPCEDIQQELETAFNQAPVREGLPLLEVIGSGSSQLNQTVNPTSNRTKTVNLRYDVDIAESAVGANIDNPTCVATTERGDKTETYEIDTNVNLYVEELVEVQNLERICRDNPAYFGAILDRLVYALDKKLATQVATQAAALTGNWATDVDVTGNRLIVNTLNASSVVPNPSAVADIDMALLQTGFENAFILGGTTLWKYMRALDAGCCADSGLNLAEMRAKYGRAFAYDRRLATALGGNDFNLAIQPNSLVLLQYTLNGWADNLPAPYKSGAYYKTVIQSPRSGVMMDLTITDNCGRVSFILIATTKLVGMPDDMYPVGDVYEGVKFVNQIRVVNT